MKKRRKTLCVLAEEKGGKKLRRYVRGARFICRRCGRAAADEDRLCRPTDL
ncbi:MAG: hypothetical protein WC969_01455 [Elusimicrobiota bacterium]|jgi:hypothetical protein